MILEINSMPSIAWFRLQEACLKNEHERALLNYKLLMHSFRSVAYKKQILGDLYILFNELDLAEKTYHESFEYYLLDTDFFHAAKIIFILKKHGFTTTEKTDSLLPELEKEKGRYALLIEELTSK